MFFKYFINLPRIMLTKINLLICHLNNLSHRTTKPFKYFFYATTVGYYTTWLFMAVIQLYIIISVSI